MALNVSERPAENFVDRVKDFYGEHETAVNLCLVGIAAAAGIAGFKALAGGEKVFEAGTPAFKALQSSERLMAETEPASLEIADGLYGTRIVAAVPSLDRSASCWKILMPGVQRTESITDQLGRSTGNIQHFDDFSLTTKPSFLEIERPSVGRVVLNQKWSTGQFFGTDGKLQLVLNPLGDEIRYGTDGKIAQIARNVRRTIDMTDVEPAT
jgi:hypothetical protein